MAEERRSGDLRILDGKHAQERTIRRETYRETRETKRKPADFQGQDSKYPFTKSDSCGISRRAVPGSEVGSCLPPDIGDARAMVHGPRIDTSSSTEGKFQRGRKKC